MMRNVHLLLLFFIAWGIFFTGDPYPYPALAQTSGGEVAKAVSVQGTVEMQRVGETAWRPVQLNDAFRPGDKIRVLERSRADVAMLDQSVLRLNANTEITVQAVKEERTGVISLLRGAAHFFSRGPGSLDVETPFATAGVRGTEFLVEVETDKAFLTVFEGTVAAANQAGSLMLTGGQSAVAEAGKAPVLRVVARPRDAVQWALYYPPVFYVHPDEFPPGPGWPGMVHNSIEFAQAGDLQKAFDSLTQAPTDIRDPRFFAYRASLLLAVGRPAEASADIERALRLNPKSGDALALQTVIAIVQNEKERALESARQAVAVAPDSVSALVALSYAQQAEFDVEGARATLERAVALDPNNALAWARLAELWSSSGELGESLTAAEKAVSLDPKLSRTQTVLGFAHLLRTETEQAKAAFEKAIALDQADSLPRLGLGLAKIREGNLHDGSRDIEIAASLDPDNSLVRSYLGKTYYEEKRTGLDEREYDTAKKLDSKDPTPWFYSAIEKQTTNRPVEALQDAQKAIELNDNRAVYRSRLLLDSDLAARSASLARIYSDLGFQDLALVEGWKSVNTDPSNFSAHRLLADSYSALPRHEIARVSELLQSQLLQPLNMTPIQPHLSISNLLLGSSGGLSFNEFNPLFNRDEITFQTSGLVGDNATYSGEWALSGIYKKFAFSLGGYRFQTNGWRSNANQRDNIADAFLQLELSPKTSIQAEYRYRLTNYGDLQSRFFQDDFFTGQRNHEDRNVFRLGGRHDFAPNSILLFSFVYQHANTNLRDTQFPLDLSAFGLGIVPSLLDTPTIEDAYTLETQHLFRSRYVNVTSGVGYAKIDGGTHISLNLLPPIGPFTLLDTKVNTDHEIVNLYSYASINPLKNLSLTLGGSGVFVHGSPDVIADKGDVKQFNPKAGITWEPIPGTTLRAAAFRNLKRTLVTNQTLEPTQVAGFNQFFDETNATESWRYGLAIDQKVTLNLFGGAEVSHRDNKKPVIDPNTLTTKKVDGNEEMARAYLFWTPHEWLALRADYLFEQFKNEQVFGNEPFRLNTHRVPLGLGFFHPSGVSSSLTATYWNQTGKFSRVTNGVVRSGNEDFWTVDVAFSYRLPNRYGFITVGAMNLFDRKFNYYEVEIRNPHLLPHRGAFLKLTLELP